MQYEHILTTGSGSSKITLSLENGLFTLHCESSWMGKDFLSVEIKGTYNGSLEQNYIILQAKSIKINDDTIAKSFSLEFIKFENCQRISTDNSEDRIVKAMYIGGAVFNYANCDIFDGIILENLDLHFSFEHADHVKFLLIKHRVPISTFIGLITGIKFLSRDRLLTQR